jgi:hypothetical protein
MQLYAFLTILWLQLTHIVGNVMFNNSMVDNMLLVKSEKDATSVGSAAK